jgi:hypothetical protein
VTDRQCGNCKWFFPGPQFSECHREPIQNWPILLGVGPPTSRHPNGTPILHLEARYKVTSANTPPCGEWAVRLEIAHSLSDMPLPLSQNNGGRN